MRPRAIETRYRGRRFRSRLEARYAVLFDHLGIKWDYEPEGFELKGGFRYLPDFFLPLPGGDGRSGYWVEIKPTDPTPDEVYKALALAAETGHVVHVFVGSPGEGRAFSTDARGVTFNGSDAGLRWAAPIVKCAAASVFEGRQFEAAVSAALGARFEFGEQG